MEFTDGQRKLIQETLEKHTLGGEGVTSIVIHQKIGKFLSMEQKEFQPKLSRAIGSGEIPGYEGRRRAGYFRIGQGPPKKEVAPKPQPVVEAPAPKLREETIDVTPEIRLRCDALNWTIEKKIIVGENPDAPVKAKEENIGKPNRDSVPDVWIYAEKDRRPMLFLRAHGCNAYEMVN